MPAGLVSSVADLSLGARAGLRQGDLLESINGNPLRDVIDVRFYAADDQLTLVFRRNGAVRVVQAQRRYGEPLGLEFASPTFDSIRLCRNRCGFCFVAQMPKHLRPSLYVKDDDYRLSFLFGTYITLNNLGENDWQRIAEQNLSPLYVSVHATDEDVRRRLMGGAQAPPVLDQLRRLVKLGVEVHTQVVLVPGVNDGGCLHQSITDLADLFPGVRSLSIVPVGLTRYHSGGCRLHTTDEKLTTVEEVRRRRLRLKEELGAWFAHLSDEWYLSLDEPVPDASEYDDLDLAENGVGAVRAFIDDAEHRLAGVMGDSRQQVLVTGTLFAPVLQRLLARFPHVSVFPVPNSFFGDSVTVAGLLVGHDVIHHLQAAGIRGRVILPPEMFGGPEATTLDGLSVAEIERALGCSVHAGEPRR